GATGAATVDDIEAFERGAAAARDSGAAGALSRLFSTRALMLDGVLAPASVPDYLSGLLIGEEFRTALFDIELPPAIADAAARGLWLLATQAGLVPPGPIPSVSETTPAC